MRVFQNTKAARQWLLQHAQGGISVLVSARFGEYTVRVSYHF